MSTPKPGYERQDVHASLVYKICAGLAIATVVVFGASYVITRLWVHQKSVETGSPIPFSTPPSKAVTGWQPQLQVSPRQDMDRMRAEEDAVLNGYGWVDPARGIAHIPITQAMEALTKKSGDAHAK